MHNIAMTEEVLGRYGLLLLVQDFIQVQRGKGGGWGSWNNVMSGGRGEGGGLYYYRQNIFGQKKTDFLIGHQLSDINLPRQMHTAIEGPNIESVNFEQN